MIYGYIRVSTDKQTVENQRYEINQFCKRNGTKIERWVEETISGTKDPGKRKLGTVIDRMKPGDVLICAELSRLGRNLLMIMGILNHCMNRGIQIWTIKDGYRLGDDISSKVLAFAFGLSAEIERNLISQRTKEALARKRNEGVILGHPKGVKNTKTKLAGCEEKIWQMYSKHYTQKTIAKRLHVHPITIHRFFTANRTQLPHIQC